MKRLPWALGPMLWLVGCVLPGEQEFLDERARTCGAAFTCPDGSTCVQGFCVAEGVVPGGDGGHGGDGGDISPLSFTLTVPPADTGGVSGGTTYEDPVLAGAWRRDQVLPVEVRINGSLDPSSLVAEVRTEEGAGPAVGVLSFPQGQPCDAGFCGVARLKLWEPPFNTFRGPMTVEVRGSDRGGIPGSASVSVNVTRWKWRHELPPPTLVTAAPALGHTGVLYVGTTNATRDDGQVLALSPEGRVAWSARGGAVVASPTVGEVRDGGGERLYVAHRQGPVSRVGFYASANGVFTPVCSEVSASNVLVESSLALAQLSDAGSPSETVYGVYNGRGDAGTLFAMRPDVAAGPLSPQCPTLLGVGDVSAPGTMLAAQGAVVFATTDGRLKSYALGGSGTSFLSRWSVPLTNPLALQPTSLALVGRTVLGGGTFSGSGGSTLSSLFAAPLEGGQPIAYSQQSSSAMWNVSIGNAMGAWAAVGLNDTGLFVQQLATGGSEMLLPSDEPIRGAPVWGAGGHLYTAGATRGLIQVRRSLNEEAAWQFESGAPIEASMNLDCARGPDGGVVSGMPGVLYAATRTGTIHALIVDSPGLDTTAAWPRYQHDARNTGNPATPITACP